MTVCEADALICLAQKGDMQAMDELVRSNMGLVHMSARRFAGRGVEYDDLVQIASMGLVKAIKRFDTAKNLALSTYAVPVILGEIKRYFRDTGSIKISRSIKETAGKCLRAREALTLRLGEEPTISEIAAECGIPAEDVTQALEALQPTVSFDEKLDEESGCTLDTLMGEDKSEWLIERIALKEAVAALSAKERQVVISRYFMSKTQSETAKAMGMSQVQISRMEKAIIAKLKSYFCVSS